MARVAVVGDSHVWEKGMKALLEEAGFDVLPASEQEAFADCAIVEVSDTVSFKLLNAVIESYPNLPVVGVVEEIDVTTVSRTLKAGAVTAIVDSSSPADIRSAIDAAVDGRTLLTWEVARSLAHHVPASEDLTEWISDSEVTWLRHMASGMTVGDLSAEIGYSERAMFRYLKALYARLGVRNRTEALLWAKQRGLLD